VTNIAVILESELELELELQLLECSTEKDFPELFTVCGCIFVFSYLQLWA
jgi:hypothetical protein